MRALKLVDLSPLTGPHKRRPQISIGLLDGPVLPWESLTQSNLGSSIYDRLRVFSMNKSELIQVIQRAAAEDWEKLELQNQAFTSIPEEIGLLKKLRELHL